MDNRIKKIIIVGGGSSGWISASYLSKALGKDVDITLIESERIPKIGVGEATIPTIKEELFDFLGIEEEEWMPACNGTYKLAIRFANWKTPAKEGGDHYYHSFGELPTYGGVPISHLWMNRENPKPGDLPFDYACYNTPEICDNYLSPRYLNGNKVVHYAYHFDALEVANFLRDWCVERGVNHYKKNLTVATLDENGFITSVVDEDNVSYEADLFVDCSGFAGFLIEKHLGEPAIDFGNSLLTDSAVAVNIPTTSKNIRPYTSAIALDAGWVWEIPQITRSGNGYVYSSAFLDKGKAEDELRSHFGNSVDDLDFRHIKFRSGRRRKSWVKNCVSFGLASSFLEPLESTGLYFVYAALYQFVQHFPDKNFNPALISKFNERVAYMVDDVKDFIILHFHTSPRTDTPFWIANKEDIVVPDSLKEKLELQKAGIPVNQSYLLDDNLYSGFNASYDRFWTNSNFQCIFNGVDYMPEAAMPLLRHKPELIKRSAKLFEDIQKRSQELVNDLPTHYEYLQSLKVNTQDQKIPMEELAEN